MIFYAKYIVSSMIFLFFFFYCNFWLNLESFYPVTLYMYFYLMSNKDIFFYFHKWTGYNGVAFSGIS